MANIKLPKGATRKGKLRGRGPGSGRGKTSGKGHKGQNSRSGGGVRPGFEGGQMPLYRRIARRGFSNYPFKKSIAVVSLGDISSKFADGDVVTLEALKERRVVAKTEGYAKILCGGEITIKVVVDGVAVSKAAAEKIIAAGGEVRETDSSANTVAAE